MAGVFAFDPNGRGFATIWQEARVRPLAYNVKAIGNDVALRGDVKAPHRRPAAVYRPLSDVVCWCKGYGRCAERATSWTWTPCGGDARGATLRTHANDKVDFLTDCDTLHPDICRPSLPRSRPRPATFTNITITTVRTLDLQLKGRGFNIFHTALLLLEAFVDPVPTQYAAVRLHRSKYNPKTTHPTQMLHIIYTHCNIVHTVSVASLAYPFISQTKANTGTDMICGRLSGCWASQALTVT